MKTKNNNKNFIFGLERGKLKSFIGLPLFSFILILLILLPGVMAVPPFVTNDLSNNGLDIRTLLFDAHTKGQSHEFIAHVFNASNGVYITNNAICYFHLYDNHGNHLVELNDTTVSHTFDYEFLVNGSYLQNTGMYAYIIQCNNSVQGGFVSSQFEVTPSGKMNNNTLFVILIIIMYSVSFVGFLTKNDWVTVLGGMSMIGLGLYTINNGIVLYKDFITNVFSWTTIGLGAFFALMSSINIVQDNLN